MARCRVAAYFHLYLTMAVCVPNKLGYLFKGICSFSLADFRTLKQASAEIRQLNKQLGINVDAAEPEKKKDETSVDVAIRDE